MWWQAAFWVAFALMALSLVWSKKLVAVRKEGREFNKGERTMAWVSVSMFAAAGIYVGLCVAGVIPMR